jgi:tripartite-type tricarboxylate transporter receptor subunit TctC
MNRNHRRDKGLRIGVLAASLPLLLVTACSGGSGGDDATDEPGADTGEFAPTKTITLVEPYDAGGGGDAYSRAFAGCLADQAGVDVVVENKTPPITGMGAVWEAKPDGYTIGSTPLPTIVGMALSQPDAVPWDPAKFEPIGIAESNGYVVYVRGDSDYETIEDLQEASGLKTLGTSPGSGSSLAAAVAIASLELDATLTFGADSSTEAALALQRGEIDFTTHGASDYPDLVDSGDVRPLLFLGNEEQRSAQYEWLQDVPGMDSIGAGDLAGVVSEYRMFSAPPGTPENVMTWYSEQFDLAFENGCMQEFSDTTGRPLLPETRVDALEIQKKQTTAITELFPRMEALLQG